MKNHFLASMMMVASMVSGAFAASAPAPYGTVPTERQVNWQRMEYYAFVHLGLNTYTDKEWGFGDEDPKLFNPVLLDGEKIAQIFKEAGMKGMIYTAKHHDGFCLWPSKTTAHNITKSPWRNGKGDVALEFAKGCHKAGIKFGVYISPWDRNNAEYARPGYVETYHKQIMEVLNPKKYGEIFEIWFDGANGGDGFYGGQKGSRSIPGGAEKYYQFQKIVDMIRKVQPKCVVWGAGHVGDARWGGSEQGHVNYPCWPTVTEQKSGGGTGVRNGDRWVPAEGDTSIRSGWFYHKSADNSVKSPEKLFQVWFDSVGRGANLILNVPPDRTGTIHPNDVKALMQFKTLRDRLLAQDFALGAKGKASNIRGNDEKKFGPQMLVDDNIESYWCSDDKELTPSVELTLKSPATFDVIRLREQIRLGQRVGKFAVDAWVDNDWKEVLQGSAIGNQCILKLKEPVTTDKVRLRILQSDACPTISEMSLLKMPTIIPAPTVARNSEGLVEIEGTGDIFYTTNGEDPTVQSKVYSKPLNLPKGGTVKAIIRDESGNLSFVGSGEFGLSKAKWKVVQAPEGTDASMAIDEDPKTFWNTHPTSGELNPPQSFTVDMGDKIKMAGFTYLPRQDGTTNGMTDKYSFEVSADGQAWVKVSQGEFSNLRANPIELTVLFNKPTEARFFRFTGEHALDKNHVSAAEIGIVPVSTKDKSKNKKTKHNTKKSK